MANSKRKCGYCKERKPANEMYIVGIQAFCNKEHWIENQVKNKDALVKNGRKIQRAELRERKENLKTAGDYLKEAQSAFNSYIRIRDANKPCISCLRESVSVFGGYRGAGGWDAGHYRSRASASHLSFNVFNVHKQCVNCNRDKSGNVVDYRINLVNRIGIERVEDIECDNKPRKFTIEYLKRIKKIFNKKSRLYKKFRDDN